MIKTLPYEWSDSVPYVVYYPTAEDDKQNPLTYGVSRDEKRQNPSRERKINLALFCFLCLSKSYEDTNDQTLWYQRRYEGHHAQSPLFQTPNGGHNKQRGNPMKKSDIVSAVSEVVDAKVAKKDIDAIYDAILSEFKRILLNGEDVALNGIGILKVRERAAREARNPKTGEKMQVPAQKAVAFKQSSVIKTELNEKPAAKKAAPAKKSSKK